jgi:hypothetical protein
MPGLVEVPPGLEIANVVDDLVLLAHASLENEWGGCRAVPALAIARLIVAFPIIEE